MDFELNRVYIVAAINSWRNCIVRKQCLVFQFIYAQTCSRLTPHIECIYSVHYQYTLHCRTTRLFDAEVRPNMAENPSEHVWVWVATI